MASCTQTSKPSMRVTMGSYRAVCKDVSVIQTVLGWARPADHHRPSSAVSDILSAFFSTPFRSLPRPLLLLLYPSSSPSYPHSYSSSSPSFGSADCAPPTPPDSSVTLPPTAILQTETSQALPPSRVLLDRRLYLFYSVLSAVIAFLPLFFSCVFYFPSASIVGFGLPVCPAATGPVRLVSAGSLPLIQPLAAYYCLVLSSHSKPPSNESASTDAGARAPHFACRARRSRRLVSVDHLVVCSTVPNSLQSAFKRRSVAEYRCEALVPLHPRPLLPVESSSSLHGVRLASPANADVTGKLPRIAPRSLLTGLLR